MPAYDYACQACGRSMEVLHGVHDVGPQACTECGGPMRKLMSTPAIHFRGSGWAKKDARDKTSSATKSGDREGTASTAGEGDPPKPAEQATKSDTASLPSITSTPDG